MYLHIFYIYAPLFFFFWYCIRKLDFFFSCLLQGGDFSLKYLGGFMRIQTICDIIWIVCIWCCISKINFPVTGAFVAQRVGRGIALLFHDHGTRRGWVVSSTPRPTLPPSKTRYPLYRRLVGRQGLSGRAEKLSPPGFDPRTVQTVAQSINRLSYPANCWYIWIIKF